jgi:predicted glycosyltransferase
VVSFGAKYCEISTKSRKELTELLLKVAKVILEMEKQQKEENEEKVVSDET